MSLPLCLLGRHRLHERAILTRRLLADEDLSMTVLAVNGTLMRGLELNPNMLRAGAAFVRETRTAPCYRLFSIRDVHPAMLRVPAGGAAIALELWEVPAAGIAEILQAEPPGLCIGKVELEDGAYVLGVLGEPWLCEGALEITRHGGWREYLAARRQERKTC